MKIVAVGRNYAEHARELGNEVPEDPVLFMKPESAIIAPGAAFKYPSFSNDIHYEIEVVLRICAHGSNVSESAARTFYKEATVGIDFTARDLQTKCKVKGLPWEIAKAFDGSAALGEFVPFPESEPFEFSLQKNGGVVQHGKTSDMLHGFDSIIHHVTRYFTLEPGDLVFTGTPSGVGPVARGDRLDGFLDGVQLLRCSIE